MAQRAEQGVRSGARPAPSPERVHRYAAALGHARGKRVVVAGERDRALLASLRGAARTLEVVQPDPFASALRLPFDDACADVVIALAGLERLADPVGFVREARRVLAAGGVLWAAFAAGGGSPWRPDTVRALLGARFASVALLAQRGVTGSLLLPLDAAGGAPAAWYAYADDGVSDDAVPDGAASAYVAVCTSAPPAAAQPASLLVDARSQPRDVAPGDAAAPADVESVAARGGARRLRAEAALRERQIAGLVAEIEAVRDQAGHQAQVLAERDRELEAERAAASASAQRLAALELRAAQALRVLRERMQAAHAAALREREQQLEAARAAAAELERQLAARDAAARELHAHSEALAHELDALRAVARTESAALRAVLGSRSWRLTKSLRQVGRALRAREADDA